MKACITYLISSVSLALSVPSPTLLVAHNNDILWLDVWTNKSFPLISADSPILAFDVHQAWRQIFWTTGQSIYRTPVYDEQTTTAVVTTGEVGGLAVDWVHNLLFWIELSEPGPGSRIEAVHLDGRGRRVVLDADWTITAIALDPQIGKLFWIESSPVGRKLKRIKSSNYDGSGATTIYKNETIQERSPLAADVVKKKINFFRRTPAFSEKVEMNYNVSDPVNTILMHETSTVHSLGLNEGGFFYSNDNGLSGVIFPKMTITLVFDYTKISATDTDTTPYFKTLNPKLKDATQLRVLGVHTQPFWPVVDTTTFHRCDQEAVPGGCVCRYGYSLTQDGRACTEDGYIFYTTGTTFGRIRLDGEHHSILYNDSSANIQALDLHTWSGHVYWSDHLRQAIYRAPAEAPNRKQEIVANSSAYGVAVDWLHGHLYWSDHSRIMVATLDGGQKAELLKDLEAPAGMAIDPVNRYIFWAECGHSLSLRRAGLDGSNVTALVDSVTCGASLTADPATRTLYWLVWTGSVQSSKYDGSAMTLVYSDLVHTMTIFGHHILWTPLDIAEIRTTQSNHSMFHTKFRFDSFNVRPSALRVMKTSQQPLWFDVCAQSNCSGLCLPRDKVFTSEILCLSADDNGDSHFTNSDVTLKTSTVDIEAMTVRAGYIEMVNSTPFSLTLRCSGNLLTHPITKPFIEVTEVDSLVPRVNVTKLRRRVQVSDKSLPFTVDSLNPSTTYSVSVRNRVTRASSVLVVHTPPPPLTVKRLPVVTVPGIETPIKWSGQNVHFSSPNVWEDLVHTDLLLLLVSRNNYSLSHSPPVAQPIMDKIKDHVKDNFVVLQHYRTKEEFDDDPSMYLGNIPWGDEFWLAMVQVTEYKQALHLDVVYSRKFGLPDPYWKAFMEDIFDDQY